MVGGIIHLFPEVESAGDLAERLGIIITELIPHLERYVNINPNSKIITEDLTKSYFVPIGIVPVKTLMASLQEARNELFSDPTKKLRLDSCSKIAYPSIFEKTRKDYS